MKIVWVCTPIFPLLACILVSMDLASVFDWPDGLIFPSEPSNALLCLAGKDVPTETRHI